jgi:hypothetical protein
MPTREPDLNIANHLSLWVHGRERPNAADYWDGNWLNVMVRVEANGATVETSGPILRNNELADFCKGLEELQSTLTGEVRLVCIEPNLGITFTGNGLGHIAANISITPDHLTQTHQFTFALDQTYVRPLIAACKDILARYPIRDAEGH